MKYVVEGIGILEAPGTTPTQARINRRNADWTVLQNQSESVSHFTVPPGEEYMTRFGQPGDEMPTHRYGTLGYLFRLWIDVRQDADNVGRAIWQRMSASGLKNGSKLEVFEHLRDEGQEWATGQTLYARWLPAGTRPDIG